VVLIFQRIQKVGPGEHFTRQITHNHVSVHHAYFMHTTGHTCRYVLLHSAEQCYAVQLHSPKEAVTALGPQTDRHIYQDQIMLQGSSPYI
jgi:hypothetical protein